MNSHIANLMKWWTRRPAAPGAKARQHAAPRVETLERRALLSTFSTPAGTAVLNNLTLTINGTAHVLTAADFSGGGLVLNGDAGATTFTISNVQANSPVTINGGGGADTVNLSLNGVSNTFHVNNTGSTALKVTAPTSGPQTVTETQNGSSGSVTVGSEVVSFDNSVANLGLVGDSGGLDPLVVSDTHAGDNLAIDSSSNISGMTPTIGYGTQFKNLTIQGSNGGNITVNDDTIPTTLNAGTGTVVFQVNASSKKLTLNGSSGTTTFNVSNNAAVLIATAGSGAATFSLSGNTSTATLTGGSTSNTFTIVSNSGTLTLNAEGPLNTTTVQGNSSILTAFGSPAANSVDTFTVAAISAAVTYTAGAGTDSVIVAAPLGATFTVHGAAGKVDTLTVNADNTSNTIAISAADITGLNQPIDYDTISNLIINGKNGNDIYNVNALSALTSVATLNGGSGNNTFNVKSVPSATTLNVNTGAAPGKNAVNLGSSVPGGVLDQLNGIINLTGNGSDTLTLDDTTNATSKTGVLSPTTITGLGLTGGVNYSGVSTLNINLGTAGNNFTVAGTSAANNNLSTGSGSSTVNVQTLSGKLGITTSSAANTINLGNIAPTVGGILDPIAGPVTLTSFGADTLNVDDKGSFAIRTGILSASSLAGFGGFGGVSFVGLANLNVSLGAGQTALTVSSTPAGVNTAIKSANGTDTVTINDDLGPTTVSALGVNDQVNINQTHAATIVNGNAQTTVNVGTLQPATGGVLNKISSTLTVTTAKAIDLDDTGSSSPRTITVTAGQITGAGMGSSGILYSGAASLSLNLGSGGNTVNLNSTSAATTLNSGAGNDKVTVLTNSNPLSINTQGGNNQVNIHALTQAAKIATGAGADTINVGSNTPLLAGNVSGLAAPLAIVGGGNTTLNIDDTGFGSARTLAVSSTTIAISGTSGIGYAGLSALNVNLGSGGNSVTVVGTSAATTTAVNSGSGSDSINVLSTSGPTTVLAGIGANVINVGSNAPSTSGTLSSVKGALLVTGGGVNDTLNLDDTGDIAARTGTLTASALTGLNFAGLTYASIKTLNLSLDNLGNTLTVANTAAVTTINSGNGADNLTIQNDSSATTLNSQGGADNVNVQRIGALTTINSASGVKTVKVGSLAPALGGNVGGIAASLVVNAGGAGNLSVDDSGSASGRIGSLSATQLTGLGMIAGVTYSGVATMSVGLNNLGNTLTVTGTGATSQTTVNAGSGADKININAAAKKLVVNTGAGANTVNLGSNAPLAGGTLAGITASVTINGGGSDSLNVDDSGAGASTATVGAASLSGLSTGAINYSGLSNFNLNLGSAGNSLTVAGTITGTSVINTGAGADSVNVRATSGPTTIQTGAGNAQVIKIGSLAPVAGGVLSGIGGALTITGSGNDLLNLDDTKSTVARTGTLTATTITGLGTAGIIYSGIATLDISLGNVGSTLTVSDTASTASTTVWTGNENDSVTISDDHGPATINTQGGTDVVNVKASHAATTINGGVTGNATVNVGSTAPAAGGSLTGIQSLLTIAGLGTDTVNVDDTGTSAARTGALSSALLTGLNMASGIAFSGVSALNINLGSGGNSFAINNTTALQTSLNSGSGKDSISVTGVSHPTTVNVGTGTGDQIDVGSTLPSVKGSLAGIQAALTIVGNNEAAVGIDDRLDASAQAGILTPTTLAGLGMGGPGVTYAGVAQLGVALGTGADIFSISNINPSTATGVSTLSPNASVTVATTTDLSGSLSLANFLNNSINLGRDLTGSLTVTGSGTVQALNIGRSITSTGSLSAGNIITAIIGADIAGTLTSTGAVASMSLGGSLAATGQVNATSLNTASIAGNLSGTLSVTGSVGSVAVNGTAPGVVTVGHINTFSALHATGNSLLNLTEAGIQRQVTATPVGGGTLASSVTFAYLFDSTGTGSPSIAIKVTNGSATAFNLSLLASAGAGNNFDLAWLGANGNSGIKTLTIVGHLLTLITSPESGFFGFLPGEKAGINLAGETLSTILTPQ